MIEETVILSFQDGSGRTRARKWTAVVCNHDPKYWRALPSYGLTECTQCYTMHDVSQNAQGF